MLGLGGLLGAGAAQNAARATDDQERTVPALLSNTSTLGRGNASSQPFVGNGGQLMTAQPVHGSDPRAR